MSCWRPVKDEEAARLERELSSSHALQGRAYRAAARRDDRDDVAFHVTPGVLAKQHHELYIVAGGIFDAHPTTIGHGVEVPRADYKIVVVLDAGQAVESVSTNAEVIAVVMPNDPSVKEKPWTAYVKSVDEVERESGYDFLSKVPEEVQRIIEARFARIP